MPKVCIRLSVLPSLLLEPFIVHGTEEAQNTSSCFSQDAGSDFFLFPHPTLAE